MQKLTIQKMVNGGYGLGHQENGQVAFIRNSLPGETVHYRILEKRKKMIFGEATDILSTPHPSRIPPPCPYYGQCGGCNLQHCEYSQQLLLKNEIVTDFFRRAYIDIPTPSITIPSTDVFHYRQRIRLQMKNSNFGYRRHHSHELIPIKKCMLAHPLINDVLTQLLQEEPFQQFFTIASELELLYNPSETNVDLLLHCSRKPRPADKRNGRILVDSSNSIGRLFFTGSDFSLEDTGVKQPPDSNSRLLTQELSLPTINTNLLLSWEVGGFCQVNLEQNVNMIEHVLAIIKNNDDSNILDLFCGMGNFSIPLGYSSASVIGIEGQRSAIRSAKLNSKKAGLSNTCFIQGSIYDECEKLKLRKEPFDLVLLDPPRTGIPGLAPTIRNLCSRNLLYISCNPATMIRDVKELVDLGFIIENIQTFDMFPQTHHIESVILLTAD